MAVQLPGRENRLREPCMHDMDEVIDRLEPAIRSCLDRPFLFFGHSLGSLIAYELLCRLEAGGQHRAELFFASGGPAPDTCLSPAEPRRLTQEQILSDLRRISSGHSLLLEDREVRALMLPMLQADFEMYANYQYRESGPLHSPIIAIRGAADAYITHRSQMEWERHTDRQFALHTVPGAHLFMVESHQALLALLNVYVMPVLHKCCCHRLPIGHNA